MRSSLICLTTSFLVGVPASFYAGVVSIGRSMVAVNAEVCAERDHAELECILRVAEGTLTYVAVGKDSRPGRFPPA